MRQKNIFLLAQPFGKLYLVIHRPFNAKSSLVPCKMRTLRIAILAFLTASAEAVSFRAPVYLASSTPKEAGGQTDFRLQPEQQLMGHSGSASWLGPHAIPVTASTPGMSLMSKRMH